MQPYTEAITAGPLPPGLSLNSRSSILGTPTTVGTYTFTVQECHSAGQQAWPPFNITRSP